MTSEHSTVALPPSRGKGDLHLADTFAEDRTLLKQFGITRVGDVTDLDVLGVPVWFAVRPNSRGLSVSQGKGLTSRQAKLSAVMEAVEGAVAEDTQRHVCAHGSLLAMQQQGRPLVPLEKLSRVNPGEVDPQRERAWVKGYSVRTASPVLAPYELIGMDFRADFPWDRHAFQMSSQGLAAGFDHDRAMLHALLELIEHDACFALGAFETRQLEMRSISLSNGISEPFDRLWSQVTKAGFAPRFFNLSSSNGIPVILAALPREITARSGPGLRIAAGTACRLDIYDAAVAALLEAIQSRLTDISGARDDLSASRYDLDHTAGNWKDAPAATVTEPSPITWIDTARDEPLWRQVAEHLFTAGVDDIHVFSLDSGIPGVSVVRVLASGLAAAGPGWNQFSASALDSFLKR